MSSYNLLEMGKAAKNAAKALSLTTAEAKNHALLSFAKNLVKYQDKILEANAQDISEAIAKGMEGAMLERLSLEGRLEGIAKDIEKIIDLPDPIGEVVESKTLENGLKLTKKRVPIGVLGIIYESRPNVTTDVSAIAIKTGNAAILKGGSETLNSNLQLAKIICQSLEDAKLPKHAIQLISDPKREPVKELLKMHAFVDLIIPRGGKTLHQFCKDNSKIPVITGGIGICHLFVESTADLDKSLDVIFNAKTDRPTVCNALDTVLIHKDIAEDFIPKILKKLGNENVDFKLDAKAFSIANQKCLALMSACELAKEQDWNTEWLSLVLGIKVVDSLGEAIAHIQKHSSSHSDGILTENPLLAKRFIDEIDSACVYVNASTRFTDGAQFGFGAEVAISTQKLHARGPMGLHELTSYKWVCEGNYHIRD